MRFIRPAKVFLFVVLLSMPAAVFSQASTIDRLKAENEAYTALDSVKVDMLNRLALENQFVSILEAFSYGREALELSVEIGYVNGEAYAYRNLGSSYAIRQDFVTAVQLLEKAQALFETIDSQRGVADCYISMGHVYRWQLDYFKAIEYQKKAADIYAKLDMPERYGVTLHNLGENYLLIGDLKTAQQVTQQATKIFKTVDNKQVLTSCYKVFGQIAFERKDFRGAEEYFNEALAISDELGKDSQKEATFDVYLMLAKIYHQQGQRSEEELMLNKALLLAGDNVLLSQERQAYTQLVNHYFFYKEYELAHKTFDAFSLINEKIYEQQKIEMANMMEQVLQTIKVANENELLRQERQLQEERITLQQYQIYFFVFSIALLGTVAILLVRSGRLRKKYTEELAATNELIEEKSKKLEELVRVKDKFFSIISHDLRSPISTLAQFVVMLKTSYKNFSDQEMEDVLGKFDSQLTSTLSLADDIILWAKAEINQAPGINDAFEVNKAIEAVVKVAAEQLRMKGIVLQAEIGNHLMVSANRDQLEFCIRNILSNSIKFTPTGGHIGIGTFSEGNMVAVKIEDNGTGISLEKQSILFQSPLKQSEGELGTDGEKGKGLGLYLVNDFMKKNGGRVEVSSEEGKGSVFTLYIPVATAS
ncbi:MAG: tetratricopeptide repeat protein [Imperialibacter sp.]|uniref:ATP-binding protein n=1 Tax=Imperialibacter sp. TaxID=2038411 RepID=UPI003A875482